MDRADRRPKLRLSYASRNVALNKRLVPALHVGMSAVFILFAALISRSPLFVLLHIVPPLTLTSLLNYKRTKICESCGGTNRKYFYFSRRRLCPRCGAVLPG